MASAHFLEFAALAVAFAGLVAVFAEVLIKDPGLIARALFQRSATQAPVASHTVVVSGGFDVVSANNNEKRKAA